MRAPLRLHGFTLLELITVIVVLGIVSALALPRLVDRASLQSRGFLDAVRASIQHARTLAVASGCEVQVQIASSTLRLQQRAGCVAPGAFSVPVPDPVEPGADYVVNAPSGMTLSASPASFVFDSLGQLTGAGNVVLSIGGSGAGSLTVFASTGFVQ